MKVALTHGYVATIDPEDWGKVKGHNWFALRIGRYVYAQAAGGLLMHRLIANAPKGKLVAHINGRRLDNRRENLRVCSRADVNNSHRKVNTNSQSGVKGVVTEMDPRTGRAFYRAQITVSGNRYRKRFNCKDKAAAWIAQTRGELLGAFA